MFHGDFVLRQCHSPEGQHWKWGPTAVQVQAKTGRICTTRESAGNWLHSFQVAVGKCHEESLSFWSSLYTHRASWCPRLTRPSWPRGGTSRASTSCAPPAGSSSPPAEAASTSPSRYLVVSPTHATILAT